MRFIPAGAGNTYYQRKASELMPVYPRWRGEHIKPEEHQLISGGLSPLARGTQPSIALESVCPRFIPAGAGNTGRQC